MKKLEDLRIKIFADGADLATMIRLNADPLIKGLTTNPSLMRKAGVINYEMFARSVLEHITEKPLSLEVFADDLPNMGRQARKIAAWGTNVYVKIPIMNGDGESTLPLIRYLIESGIKVNVTAIMTKAQAFNAQHVLHGETPCIISIFNGRIMDTGMEPMQSTLHPTLWASTREPWNIWQADAMGYDIITVPDPILAKARTMQGRDLTELSLETVRQFKKDSEGYTL